MGWKFYQTCPNCGENSTQAVKIGSQLQPIPVSRVGVPTLVGEDFKLEESPLKGTWSPVGMLNELLLGYLIFEAFLI